MWFDYFVPYRRTFGKGGHAWVTWGLILANWMLFLWELSLTKRGLLPLFLQDYALVPDRFLHDIAGLWPTLISHIFVHGDWLHLIGNMYYLWIFGPPLERRVGSIEFLCFFLSWGVVGALTQVGFESDTTTYLLGASGAIAGILGAMFVLEPLVSLPIIGPSFTVLRRFQIQIPNFLFLGFWFLLQMVRGVGSLTDTGEEVQHIAYWAHAGGFSCGALSIYAWLLHQRRKKS